MLPDSAPLVDPADFPAAAQRTYLNAASVALMLSAADRAAAAWHRDLAEHGTLHFDEAAEDRAFDDLRRSAAALLETQPNDIAIASSATELIASLAWALMPAAGRTVVSTDIVFPSTAYPWARVARHTGASLRLVPAHDGVIDDDQLIDAIDERTAVVSICHVEYSNGQRYDLGRLAEATRRVGAFLLVDASQSLGGVPLSVRDTPVDAVVSASYKWLCGPFGAGLLYLAPEWQERLDPGIVGWRTNAAIYDLRADRCVPHPDARRFESSTMAYGSAIGLSQAIDQMRQIGIDRIFSWDLALGDRLVAGLGELGVEVVSPEERSRRSGIVSARFPGRDPKDVVRHLGRAGVVVSPRRDLVRFSPHLYNSDADIDRALEAVGEMA
ncbi:MAG: aminotransferase class V-fold PLP-dependent enzyme [Gemmatimonadales bacterium]